MNKTFTQETRIKIYEKYWHKCANSEADGCKINEGLSIHHLIHNTKPNQKKYGDLLQSQENGLLLCQQCHNNQSTFGWIQTLAKSVEDTFNKKINEHSKK